MVNKLAYPIEIVDGHYIPPRHISNVDLSDREYQINLQKAQRALVEGHAEVSMTLNHTHTSSSSNTIRVWLSHRDRKDEEKSPRFGSIFRHIDLPEHLSILVGSTHVSG
jgi:hypothetical protein